MDICKACFPLVGGKGWRELTILNDHIICAGGGLNESVHKEGGGVNTVAALCRHHWNFIGFSIAIGIAVFEGLQHFTKFIGCLWRFHTKVVEPFLIDPGAIACFIPRERVIGKQAVVFSIGKADGIHNGISLFIKPWGTYVDGNFRIRIIIGEVYKNSFRSIILGDCVWQTHT